MFGFGSRNEFVVDGRTVVITGGSDGMGKAVAIQLAQKGANVVVVSRTVRKLEEAVESLKSAASDPSKQRFHYISADLTNPAEAERVLDEVTTWNNGAAPDVVWCCAGYCTPGFFIDTPIQTLRDQMDTIYWTAAYTAHATLRRWLAPISPEEASQQTSPPPRRHLIFTSSTLAFFPVTGYGPYSPGKAAMRSLADTLCQEVEMYNGTRRNKKNAAPAADVKIHTVFPMGILSPGYENEQKLKPALTQLLEEADKPQTPEEVARISIKALERGDYLITTMLVGHLMKGTALGPSPRNNIVLDTLTSWASSLIFVFVIPDLAKKAWNWGKNKGLPRDKPVKKEPQISSKLTLDQTQL
ncbi:3-dehydrosphinganine reductase [Rasamsonia emersonii CBS 393.64]|uniref:3-dehydrosphinganine reductase n=1 Tax=Rasamsonia emersonii (strain ATCC 16479 / CBS 393.64 / IMI 116815) TaxID=1408163 RepID=A0A0F4YE08_RASE3|nr:3-dehydrosphinganine reductase [Rasamsonia emersonii CBS 393.64]KKA16417.1 3-dehydrosphinganine reductase [Rasamsonia emersonii CBS 393.64]